MPGRAGGGTVEGRTDSGGWTDMMSRAVPGRAVTGRDVTGRDVT